MIYIILMIFIVLAYAIYVDYRHVKLNAEIYKQLIAHLEIFHGIDTKKLIGIDEETH